MASQSQEELLAARLKQQIIDEDGGDDEDDTEDDEEDEGEGEDGSGKSKRSRIEKKSRKAMMKLGMTAVTGVNCVTMKRNRNMLLIFTKPAIFKFPNTDMYVIFGEVQIEDLSSLWPNQAAEKSRVTDSNKVNSEAESSSEFVLTSQEDQDEDETGFQKRDIELVMGQATVSRAKAVKALKAADGDIVTAILDLTN